ncbi:DUF2188 domain-containing protein [Bradyrhizobium septentrionale]|uniref:DUF2188 domain-containing protein n=1 Tax=Bradyrhizobium septentrionale TaxID=1404411 RepID=UPI003BB1725D
MEGCAHCEHSGAYATEEEAIRAAVDAAHKEGKAGRDAQVLVQGHDHRFRNEWTYGTKTYTHVRLIGLEPQIRTHARCRSKTPMGHRSYGGTSRRSLRISFLRRTHRSALA